MRWAGGDCLSTTLTRGQDVEPPTIAPVPWLGWYLLHVGMEWACVAEPLLEVLLGGHFSAL